MAIDFSRIRLPRLSRRATVILASSVGAVAVLVVGGVLLAGVLEDTVARRAAEAGAEGTRMQINLVTPPPEDVEAGSTMAVGDLVDGYEHVEAPPLETVADGGWDPAWDDAAPYAESIRPLPPRAQPPQQREVRRTTSQPPQAPVPVGATPVQAAAPTPPESARRSRPSFGFDEPRPDYAEQRRQRQAELDARVDRRRQREAERDAEALFF